MAAFFQIETVTLSVEKDCGWIKNNNFQLSLSSRSAPTIREIHESHSTMMMVCSPKCDVEGKENSAW